MEPGNTFSETPGETPEPGLPARAPSGEPARTASFSPWRWAALVLIALLAATGNLPRLFSSSEPLTFDNANVSMTYPAGWNASSEWAQADRCGEMGLECLSKAVHTSGAAMISVTMIPLGDSDVLIEEVAQAIAAQSDQNGELVREEERWREVDGKRAYDILTSADNPTSGMRNYARTVVVIYNRQVYVFGMVATNEVTLHAYDAEFDTLLNSVAFTPADE